MHSWLGPKKKMELAKNKRENNKVDCPDLGAFSLLLQIAFSGTAGAR
jgi:hypothetical protein